jgi:hypothetical protein
MSNHVSTCGRVVTAGGRPVFRKPLQLQSPRAGMTLLCTPIRRVSWAAPHSPLPRWSHGPSFFSTVLLGSCVTPALLVTAVLDTLRLGNNFRMRDAFKEADALEESKRTPAEALRAPHDGTSEFRAIPRSHHAAATNVHLRMRRTEQTPNPRRFSPPGGPTCLGITTY